MKQKWIVVRDGDRISKQYGPNVFGVAYAEEDGIFFKEELLFISRTELEEMRAAMKHGLPKSPKKAP